MRLRSRGAFSAAAVLVVAAGLSVGVPTSAEAAGLCIPIPLLVRCPSSPGAPSPTPTPTPTPTGTPGGAGGSGGATGDGNAGGNTSTPGTPGPGGASSPTPTADATPAPAWGPATPDDSLVVTQPAAQLSGSSIEIGGLSGVALVQLPRADGSRSTVIRLSADSIAVEDFTLDVRGESNGTSAVTTDTRMELRGHVQVYVDSVTAELPGGGTLTLGADTPPPGRELPSQWLRVDLGLVAATADGITHTGSDLAVRPGSAS